MENLNKRIGFFLRDTSDVKTNSGESRYVFRYFIIDNDFNLHYTANYSHIQNAIKTSSKFSDLFIKVNKYFKSISFTDIKIGEIKDYPKPELLPFLNNKYFDVEIAFPESNLETSANRTTSQDTTTGLNRQTTITKTKGGEYQLMFFSFKDQHLLKMQSFLKSYHKNSSFDLQDQNNSYITFFKNISSTAALDRNKQNEVSRLNDKLVALQKNYQKILQI
jgi:hypothetical protein